MKLNMQWICTGLLLILAVYYVIKTIIKSFKVEHDCPDCGVAVDTKKKVKRHLSQPGKQPDMPS
jgi:hypothetical protein